MDRGRFHHHGCQRPGHHQLAGIHRREDTFLGRLKALSSTPVYYQVTHVLLQEGHLWGRKEVAIPIEAVTRVEAGIRLNLSERQVEDLPPVAIEHNPLVVIYGHKGTRRAGT